MRDSTGTPKSASLIVVLFLSLVPASLAATRQMPRPVAPAGSFLDNKIPEFDLVDDTIVNGVWKLARGPVPFAFGFEHILKKSLQGPEPKEVHINIHLKDQTVRHVLDALCRADSRFTWSTDGATVNIFPIAVAQSPSYLLNRKFKQFELKNATDVQNGLLAIVHQLPPPKEQVAQAQSGGDDPYPAEPWTLSLQNVTVRQVVNRLASHGGPCGIWIFGGSEDFRAFGFFNTYLQCAGNDQTRSQTDRRP